MRIKKGDTVLVIAGDDRGKTGRVLKIVPDSNRVIIEGVNFIKRHTRPTQRNPKGGIVEKEATIHCSNVMLYCSKCSSPTRPGFKMIVNEESQKREKVRVCRSCGEII